MVSATDLPMQKDFQPGRLPFVRKYPGTLLLLAVLTLAAYGVAALTPSIFGDEWGILGNYIDGIGPVCPDWQSARPFTFCWHWLVFKVGGLNIYFFHAAALAMNFISALLLLICLDILLPDWPTYNGAVTALALVFPADVTRTFLAGNVVFGAAVYLAAGCFLAAFWRSGRWWMWIAGMLVLAFALGTYEVSVGITIALSGLAFLSGRHRTWPQRVALLIPALAAVLFSLWRWRWQQTSEGTFGYVSENVVFSPAILLERLMAGARYVLHVAWTDTIINLFPWLPPSGRIGNAMVAVVVVGLVLFAVAAAYWVIRSTAGEQAAPVITTQTRRPNDIVAAGLVGLAMVIAGYFPIILAQFPGGWYAISRAHHVSSIGASLVICSLIFGIALLIGRNLPWAKVLAVAGVAPLVALGIAAHLMVHQQTRQAWADQKEIWQTLFELAPDIADGTHVVFILNEYNSSAVPLKGPGPFIQGDWGMNNAIRILYGKKNIFAHFGVGWPQRIMVPDGDTLVLADFGERRYPAAETLVFMFGKNDRQLVQWPVLEKDGVVLPLGAERIMSTPTEATDYRWLVSDE